MAAVPLHVVELQFDHAPVVELVEHRACHVGGCEFDSS